MSLCVRACVRACVPLSCLRCGKPSSFVCASDMEQLYGAGHWACHRLGDVLAEALAATIASKCAKRPKHLP